MDKPRVYIFDSLNHLALEFCEFLLKEIKAIPAGKDVHVCLSGGNSPKIVFQLLKEKYFNIFPWDRIHFYWGDERCVSPDNHESNYGEAKRILFDHINIPNTNIHSIHGDNNPDNEVKRYAKLLLNKVPIKRNMPCFDINILGMGNDGHTASIFPDTLNLIESDTICAVSKHPETGQKRITLTGKVLNNSKNICFIITGSNKAKILQQIIQQDQTALKYPAYYINVPFGNLYYFIDKPASANLNQIYSSN